MKYSSKKLFYQVPKVRSISDSKFSCLQSNSMNVELEVNLNTFNGNYSQGRVYSRFHETLWIKQPN